MGGVPKAGYLSWGDCRGLRPVPSQNPAPTSRAPLATGSIQGAGAPHRSLSLLCATLVSSDSVPHSLLSLFQNGTEASGGSWASAIKVRAGPSTGLGIRQGWSDCLPGVDKEGGTDLVPPRCEAPLAQLSLPSLKVKVTQSYPTLCNPVDYSRSSQDSQTRILEWASVPFSRDLPNPGIELRVEGGFFTI